MLRSLGLYQGPRLPRDLEAQYTDTRSWEPWLSCPSGHSLFFMRTPKNPDIIAVLSIHATLLADHVSKCLTRMGWLQTDSGNLFQKNILKLAVRDDPFWPACSSRSTMWRIALKGYST